jgi:hypothetical protein
MLRSKLGALSFRAGLGGFGVLALAFVLTGVALSLGVHCPECDRHTLTAESYANWKTYFAVKDGVYGVATLLLALAMPLSVPRRWPFVLGFVLALMAFAATPQ